MWGSRTRKPAGRPASGHALNERVLGRQRCAAPPTASSPTPPPTQLTCPLPEQVDVDEMLALNGLDPAAPLALNFKLKLPEWNATCPADGIPAVLPSDTVE